MCSWSAGTGVAAAAALLGLLFRTCLAGAGEPAAAGPPAVDAPDGLTGRAGQVPAPVDEGAPAGTAATARAADAVADAAPAASLSVRVFTPNDDGVYDEVLFAPGREMAPGDRVVVRRPDGAVARETLPVRTVRQDVLHVWDGKDAGGLPAEPGAYQIALLDPQGRARAACPVTLEKRKPWPPLVWDGGFFPLGVWAAGLRAPGDGDAARLAALFHDLETSNGNAVYVDGGDWPLVLDTAREHGLSAVIDFREPASQVFGARDAPTEQELIERLSPVMAPVKDHPALLAYYVFEKPAWHENTARRLRALQQVMGGIDSRHPALVCLMGLDSVVPYASVVRPPLLLMDVHPLQAGSGPGQFNSMYGTGVDMLDYLDQAMAPVAERGARTWIVHAAHASGNGGREPTPAEVRLQAWLSLTRAADGFFYVFRGSPQAGVGADDAEGRETARRQALDEVYRRLQPLLPLLLKLKRTDPLAIVEGGGNAYYERGAVGALTDGKDRYLVVANRDVENAETLTLGLNQGIEARELLDLTEQKAYAVSGRAVSLTLGPGQGTILKVVK